MRAWHKEVQTVVREIDQCIRSHTDEALTLRYLSQRLGYSEYYISHKFSEISGMSFRDY